MYKRNIKPLLEFLGSSPPPGRYYIDAGFGKLYYKSSEVAGTINTRTDASGATVICEVHPCRQGLEVADERGSLLPAGDISLHRGGTARRRGTEDNSV